MKKESQTRQAFNIMHNVLDTVGAILVLLGTIVPLAVCIWVFLSSFVHH